MQLSFPKSGDLDEKKAEKTKKLSIAEGSATSIMQGCGEQYVVPFALRLGATTTEIAILSSVPTFLSSFFQIIGAKLTDRFQNRKALVLLFVLFQALIFAPLFLIPFFTKSVLALALFFTLYLIFGNLSGPSWSSWMGDVVTQDQRSSYFSKRNKIVLLFLFLSVLISGIILNSFESINIWLGFAILFSLALIGRFISFLFFLKHDEPSYSPDLWDDYRFKDFLKDLRTTSFGSFVIFRSVTGFAVLVASPFFAVYMLEDLQFTYVQFSAMLLVPMLVKAFTMTYWGAISSKIGNKPVMLISSILVAIIPLYWFIIGILFQGTGFAFWTLIFLEVISGFGWAGVELTTFNYMLDNSTPKRRARLFAYYTVVYGFAILLGGLAASGLMILLRGIALPFSAILTIFIISTALRFLAIVLFLPKVKDISTHGDIDSRRLFYEVVIVRPLGYAASTAASTMALIDRVSENVAEAIKELAEDEREEEESLAKEKEKAQPARHTAGPSAPTRRDSSLRMQNPTSPKRTPQTPQVRPPAKKKPAIDQSKLPPWRRR